MMAAILTSTMLDWDTAILDSDTLLSSLRLTQKLSHSTLTLTETNSIWLKLIHSHLTWWWQPSWILPLLNLDIMDSAILVFSFKLTHTCQDWFPPFAQNISLIHFDSIWWWQPSWTSVMLYSYTAILDSDIFLSSLRYTQKHSHSTLTLTQTNSIWLKLIHSHLTWWWQPSWILPSWIWPSCIQPSWYFLSMSLTLAKIGSHHLHKKTSLIHSDSIWWWQPSWILSCWIQTLPSWILISSYLLSDSLKNTLTPLWLLLKLIQSDSNSFIFT